MGVEIERKFLLKAGYVPETTGERIAQGYLQTDPARTVRVRVRGERAYLTIKGKNEGARRAEYEYEIPLADGRELLALTTARIEKDRYKVPFAGKMWEIDIFHGKNEGLAVAEIELKKETETFRRPPWVTEDVTDDARYYNSALAAHPYADW